MRWRKTPICDYPGATQSNHVRQTIAGAAKLGLAAKVLLEKRVTDFGEDYQRSGNILLDDLLGGEIVAHLPGGTDMQQAMEEYAATLREQGHNPYIIPAVALTPLARWAMSPAPKSSVPVFSVTLAYRSRRARHRQHGYTSRAGRRVYRHQQPGAGAGD
jgi:hypothetical protein